MQQGLPRWSSGKESALQCRGRGSIPGWGTKIPHVAGQLRPCSSTREPMCHKLQGPRALEPVRHSRREAHAPQQRAHLPQRKDPACRNEGPACRNENLTQPKFKNNDKNFKN